MEQWDFVGWGKTSRITDLGHDPIKIHDLGVTQEKKNKLGQWPATAICGNDITSSCLYVSALSIVTAGAYAPLVLLIVSAVLFLFRKIYSEVGSALPLNGGTYTVLLNTTNKKLAAGAACLTLLSYVATAVISAGEAMHYAQHLWNALNIPIATVLLLGFFAFLNFVGMKESSILALLIFIFHMTTLTLLVIAAGFFVIKDPSMLIFNFSNPLPPGRGLLKALVLGFSAAMLGISGFESSANFIEEQKEGVFPKTLRNMWIAVSIFNPLIALLALGILSQADVQNNTTTLLAVMGDNTWGHWFKTLISLDAVIVLSGAVLTSYVGVIGLMRRMSLDQCIPQIFLSENNWRKTNHWIIVAFFVLCCGIFYTTSGKVEALAGVYTISFLCVMALFAIGNMLLKSRRTSLPRKVRANWGFVFIALVAVLIALVGNLTGKNIKIFGEYFALMSAVVALMLFRVSLMKFSLYLSRIAMDNIRNINQKITDAIVNRINLITSQKVVFFTKGDDLPTLNSAATYVLNNETTHNLLVVHAYEKDEDIPKELASHLQTIDRIYPQLRIDFLAVKGTFGPDMIERLSRQLNIPKNYMFIGTPGDYFPHRISSLGGVRLILG